MLGWHAFCTCLPMNSQHSTHVLVSRDAGGGERLAVSLAHSLSQDPGSRAELLYPLGGSTEQLARASGLPGRGYDFERLFDARKLPSALEGARVVLPRLAASGCVHIHAPFLYQAMRRYLLGAVGLRKIVHVHLDYQAESLRHSFRQPPDDIVVCADFLRDGVEQALPDDLRKAPPIHVVRNAVDTTRFHAEGREHRAIEGVALEGRVVITVVANLAPHKGQHTALTAAALMIREGLPVSLLLVGSCRPENHGYDTVLREQASALGIADSVHFLGQRDDIGQILRASDFMVLASTNEGLPLSILEAQACGAVVLAAPTAGVPEVVKDGQTGYLIAAEDAHGYAQRMTALMRDAGLRRGIAAQAQANILRSHTWSAYVEQIREIYASRPRPGFMLGRFALDAGARARYLR